VDDVSGEPALLEVESLGVRAGGRWIVEAVTFQARAGEVTAVIGPNGAGKTTLLETIAGVRRADAGQVRVEGRRLVRFVEHARSLSFLPDAGVLPPEATVRTLVDHARSRSQRPAQFETLLDALHVGPLLPKSAGVLSRGEHQRVSLFCALALGRGIVLLDEPFSTFDPLQLRDVLTVVRAVAKFPTAVVASVHQLVDAERIADRVLLLAGGRAVAFADPASLRAQAGTPSATLEEVFVALLSRRDHAS
jgi:ABC-2 type transport system ATP-binding protein